MVPPVDPRVPSLPAVVILGNDAQLAARPATPVQLAHACLAAGFRAAIPASWGDELVAAAALNAITSRGTRPAIQCACPHVARRMLAVGTELAPHLVSLVAPPVAVAKYLRLHSPQGLRVTYVGRCPAASDDSIDARLTPDEFLTQLAERGIRLADQPEMFESVIPPDRRRHFSLPGGLPSPDELWRSVQMRVEILEEHELATTIADRVLARAEVLVDVAPVLGCVCSGVMPDVPADAAREAVAALEPPRSPFPVLEDPGALSLELPIPVAARNVSDAIADAPRRVTIGGSAAGGAGRADVASREPRDAPLGMPAVSTYADLPPRRPRLTPPGAVAVPQVPPPTPAAAPTAPRRRSPPGTVRLVSGTLPLASDQEGRVLPRAYVARRRSPRGGVPVVTDETLGSAAQPAPPVERQAPVEEPAPARDAERPIEHSVEPVASAPPVTPPLALPHAAATAVAPRRSPGPFERSLTLLAANRRVTLIVALAAAGMLAGVAIGWAAARRSESRPEMSETRGSSLKLDSSAASAAPALTAGVERRGGASASTRPPATARRATGSRRASSAQPTAPRPAAPSPAPVQQIPAAVPIDSTAIRARRDSALAVVRAESVAAEREAIRREIERRRARIDSLTRAQAGSPPTER
ncbi:MAG TPA: [Fe-Fe] hydrogenase large subunit C-terminal domain-containing protein [Gemmatimonadaceae bacterium]|nr:[Fe-Fe] hydrogenase large subunit C-terminal domain-containing protein [Gemmatimonadaceae bacterium]